MERLCFDERDTNFHRTTPSPRLPPPVLGRDGKISFPPIEGFGEKAPPAQGTAPAAHVRMQFVPAGVTAHHAARPSGRPSVQIDDAAPRRQLGAFYAPAHAPYTPEPHDRGRDTRQREQGPDAPDASDAPDAPDARDPTLSQRERGAVGS
jgi:hypothetical protein